MNKILKSSLALLIVILLMTSLLSPATAQRTVRSSSTNSETIVSELAGAEITLDTSTRAIFEGQSVARDGGVATEVVSILLDKTYVDLVITDQEVTPAEARQVWEESVSRQVSLVEWLGGETGTNKGWDLYSTYHYLAFRDLALVEFRANALDEFHILISITGTEPTFLSDVSWISDNVTIAGKSPLPDTDIVLLETIISGESDYVTRDVSIQATDVSDWADVGLVSETEWNDPSHPVSVTWDQDLWQFAFNDDAAILLDDGRAMLILQTPDRTGMTKIRIVEGDVPPSDYVDMWLSDEYREREAKNGFEFTVVDSYISETTGSVILRFEAHHGEPVIVIRDTWVNDDGLVILTEVFAAPEDIARVYADFWDGVQANGEYYPLTWTIEDIEALPKE